MQIDKHAVVSLNYKLSNHKTGDKIEETSADSPMVFLFGAGQLIPDFENNVHGLKVGDNFEFVITADKAYGVPSEDNIVNIPLDVFKNEEGVIDTNEIKVGAVLPMSDDQGHSMLGTILGIDAAEVRMDFNHPLAGTDLHFTGSVSDVRKATQDEIDHGHVHGPHGHHH
jgi:FKBP-type peptidyl-prolyl cis-trans isomerase SlyD